MPTTVTASVTMRMMSAGMNPTWHARPMAADDAGLSAARHEMCRTQAGAISVRAAATRNTVRRRRMVAASAILASTVSGIGSQPPSMSGNRITVLLTSP